MGHFTVIVVDDEESTRTGLAEYVDWTDLGFTLAGSFADGESALSWLQENSVDVVLSDIRMPGVSGLELVERIRSRWPSVQIVLISGHKEFEYARRALEFGVRHYILKPTKLPEVRKTFRRISDELRAKQTADQTTRTRLQKYHDSLPYLVDQFVFDVLTGRMSNEVDIRMRSALIDAPFDPISDRCALVSVSIDANAHELPESTRARADSFEHLLALRTVAAHVIVTAPFEERYVIVLTAKPQTSPEELHAEAGRAGNRAVEALQSTGVQVVDVTTEQFRSLLELSQRSDIQGSTEVQEDMTDLLPILHEIHRGDLRSGLEKLLSLVERNESVNHLSKRSILGALSAADARLLELRAGNAPERRPDIPYAELARERSATGVTNLSRSSIGNLLHLLEADTTPAARATARSVADYVERHFDEELSLSGVAEQYRLNPDYLSRLFHHEIGVTFTDFLTDVRLTAAAGRLADKGAPVRDVARACGYADPKYFSKVFRRRYGITPRDFARLHRPGTIAK